jgi:hypothetical protein
MANNGIGIIKAGDVITFKPEWRDRGDEKYTFRALEDEEDGSLRVVAEIPGFALQPNSIARTAWIETVNGEPYYIVVENYSSSTSDTDPDQISPGSHLDDYGR